MLTAALSAVVASAAPVPRDEVSVHTAHGLGWGEVMVGTSGIHVGALPRVQLGVRPVLTALGLPSGSVRVVPIDTQPFDLAVTGTGSVGTWPGTRVSALGAGATASLQVWRVGLHGGVSRSWVHADGLPERAPWWVPVGEADPIAALAGESGGAQGRVHGAATTLRGAAELRVAGPLWVVGHGARTWSNVTATVGGVLPAEVAELDPTVTFPGAWTASVSLKLALGRVNLRAGYGASNVPYAWVPQAMAAHLRLGGPRPEPEPEGVAAAP